MAARFLDTNVLLRHLLQDHSAQSSNVTRYLAAIEAGQEKARIADTVIFETVFTLQRQYGVPKLNIRDTLLPLIDLSGIILPGKRRLREVFDLYVIYNISFADAFHAVLMKRWGLSEIVSYDRGFDKIPGIIRVEP
jgi:predicted nucleic acid-binding protein